MRSNCFVGNSERIAPAVVDQAQAFAARSFVQRRSATVAPTGCEFISKVKTGSLQEDKFDQTEFDCMSSSTTDVCTAWISGNMTKKMPCEASLDDINTNEGSVDDSSIGRTYILCPDKKYTVGSSPIVIGQPNMHVICGIDGDSNNDCFLSGGMVQLKISDEFRTTGTIVPAANALVQGLTFEEASATNILAQFPGEIRIQNCIFLVRTSKGIPCRKHLLTLLGQYLTHILSCSCRTTPTLRPFISVYHLARTLTGDFLIPPIKLAAPRSSIETIWLSRSTIRFLRKIESVRCLDSRLGSSSTTEPLCRSRTRPSWQTSKSAWTRGSPTI